MIGSAPDKHKNTYFRNIGEATLTLLEGLKLTWRHFLQSRHSRKPIGIENEHYFEQQTGIVTLQYPKESLPVPENGRYRLHNEIDDCIVCDKCAKICPVDCIEIEPVKAVETIGQTSDGTPKRIYAARFDIDMAKCCFCGLCTTVCPTECLTMTKVYDFSEFDVVDHTYAFAEMSPLEILQKRKELEEFQAQKAAAKPAAATGAKPGMAKPAARPGVAQPSVARPGVAQPGVARPKTATTAEAAASEAPQETARELMEQKATLAKAQQDSPEAVLPNPTATPPPTPQGTEDSPAPGANKPTFRPRPLAAKPMVSKPKVVQPNESAAEQQPADSAADAAVSKSSEAQQTAGTPKPRPVMKPVLKKAAPASEPTGATEQSPPATAKEEVPAAPKPRPVMKPVLKKTSTDAEGAKTPEQLQATEKLANEAQAATTPAKPRPVMKPLIKKTDPDADTASAAAQAMSASSPPAIAKNNVSEETAPAKAKPRPVMKPVIRKSEAPPAAEASAAGATELPKPAAARPRPVIRPNIPKKANMQADNTPQEREATEKDIKKPVPVVEKKVVTHKPAQENKTEEEKRQDDSQRPNAPGLPD